MTQTMWKAARVAVVCAACLASTGCMTAALVGMKAVADMRTMARGPVQTKFANEQAGPAFPSEFGGTRSVAIWMKPDVEGAAFAQAWEKSGQYERVVGPAMVAEALRGRGMPSDVGAMVASERVAASAEIAKTLGVDGVLVFAVRDEKVRAGDPLVTGARNLRAQGYWFDGSAGKDVWTADVSISAQLVSSKIGPVEIMTSAADAIRERLRQLQPATT